MVSERKKTLNSVDLFIKPPLPGLFSPTGGAATMINCDKPSAFKSLPRHDGRFRRPLTALPNMNGPRKSIYSPPNVQPFFSRFRRDRILHFSLDIHFVF
jgi:hypothetical protein